MNEIDDLQYTGIDGRIILKRIFRKWEGGRDWIHVAQKRDWWCDLMNAAMKLRDPKIRGYSLTSLKHSNLSRCAILQSVIKIVNT